MLASQFFLEEEKMKKIKNKNKVIALVISVIVIASALLMIIPEKDKVPGELDSFANEIALSNPLKEFLEPSRQTIILLLIVTLFLGFCINKIKDDFQK